MARKHHTRRSMKRHAKKTHRVRKMRGGEAPVDHPYATGGLVLPQGMAFRGMTHTGGDSPFYGVKSVVPMQQGGEAPYPGSGRFDGGLAQAAGTASIDRALEQVAGLRDPNQMQGVVSASPPRSPVSPIVSPIVSPTVSPTVVPS